MRRCRAGAGGEVIPVPGDPIRADGDEVIKHLLPLLDAPAIRMGRFGNSWTAANATPAPMTARPSRRQSPLIGISMVTYSNSRASQMQGHFRNSTIACEVALISFSSRIWLNSPVG